MDMKEKSARRWLRRKAHKISKQNQGFNQGKSFNKAYAKAMHTLLAKEAV